MVNVGWNPLMCSDRHRDTGYQQVLLVTLLLLDTKHQTKAVYHLHMDGPAERLNETVISLLPHYMPAHQRAWDIYMQLVTYAYTVQLQRSTDVSPFSLVYHFTLLGLLLWTVPRLYRLKQKRQHLHTH